VSGASRARTGDLLGAIQAMTAQHAENTGLLVREMSDSVGESRECDAQVGLMPNPEHGLALERLHGREDFVAADDYVLVSRFGRRLDPSALRRRYKRGCAAAGLRPVRLHGLRHAATASSTPRCTASRSSNNATTPKPRPISPESSPKARPPAKHAARSNATSQTSSTADSSPGQKSRSNHKNLTYRYENPGRGSARRSCPAAGLASLVPGGWGFRGRTQIGQAAICSLGREPVDIAGRPCD
jgi:hypothetical protein